MKRKKFYSEIYKDIIRSLQELEDENLSEWCDCLYDYFLDHGDIISQYSTFNFSKEHSFNKSALDCVAKGLLPKDCHALLPIFAKVDGNCLYNSISLFLTGEKSQFSTELKIKVPYRGKKNRGKVTNFRR